MGERPEIPKDFEEYVHGEVTEARARLVEGGENQARYMAGRLDALRSVLGWWGVTG